MRRILTPTIRIAVERELGEPLESGSTLAREASGDVGEQEEAKNIPCRSDMTVAEIMSRDYWPKNLTGLDG